MEILDIEFTIHNHSLKQIKRDGKFAIYERRNDERILGYEVVVISVMKDTTFPNGKFYPEHEIYPNNEKFGNDGFYFMSPSKDKAFEKYRYLIENYDRLIAEFKAMRPKFGRKKKEPKVP